MCFGAPLLAGWVAGFDRRRLLAARAALVRRRPRALRADAELRRAAAAARRSRVLGAAVFTPQAAAAIGFMAPPEQRGRAITFIFLGWSVASVLGLPMAHWIGETFGWRCAFAAIAVLALVGRGLGLRRDARRRAPGGALAARLEATCFTHPVLMAIVAVTALFGAGQFTLFSYFTPYFRDVLHAERRPDRACCSSGSASSA